MSKKLAEEEYKLVRNFREFLKKDIHELPNRPAERRETQWSLALNEHKDKVGFFLGAEVIQLYIRSGVEDRSKPKGRTLRMKEYSRLIQKQLGDQQSLDDKGQEDCGASIRVQRTWSRDSEEQWPHLAKWVNEQYVELKQIIVSMK